MQKPKSSSITSKIGKVAGAGMSVFNTGMETYNLVKNWNDMDNAHRALGTVKLANDTAKTSLKVEELVSGAIGKALGTTVMKGVGKVLVGIGSAVSFGMDLADAIKNNDEWNEWVGSTMYMVSDFVSMIPGGIGAALCFAIHLVGYIFAGIDWHPEETARKMSEEADKHQNAKMIFKKK
jgi:hypothetical protein